MTLKKTGKSLKPGARAAPKKPSGRSVKSEKAPLPEKPEGFKIIQPARPPLLEEEPEMGGGSAAAPFPLSVPLERHEPDHQDLERRECGAVSDDHGGGGFSEEEEGMFEPFDEGDRQIPGEDEEDGEGESAFDRPFNDPFDGLEDEDSDDEDSGFF